VKKILKIFFSFSLFLKITLFAFSPVFAQGGFYIRNPFTENLSLQDLVANMIDVVFVLAGVVAVIFLIIGGFGYVTSAGNPEAAEKAKSTIANALVGLVVIFIAALLVNFILVKMGVKENFRILGIGGNRTEEGSGGGPGVSPGGGGPGLPITPSEENPDTLDLSNAEHLAIFNTVNNRGWRYNPNGYPEYGRYARRDNEAVFDNTDHERWPRGEECPPGLEYGPVVGTGPIFGCFDSEGSLAQ